MHKGVQGVIIMNNDGKFLFLILLSALYDLLIVIVSVIGYFLFNFTNTTVKYFVTELICFVLFFLFKVTLVSILSGLIIKLFCCFDFLIR